MNIIKRSAWQFVMSLVQLVLQLLFVIVCFGAFLLSPIAQFVVWSRRRPRNLKGRK